MSKHTPGPWEWDGNPCDYDPKEESPWLVRTGHEYPPILGGEITCTSEANARLIASAPDLLEALKAFINVCDNANPMEFVKELGAVVEPARQAIAKAEGKP